MKQKAWIALLIALIAITIAQTWSPSERPNAEGVESTIELATFNSVAKSLFGMSQILLDQREKLLGFGFSENDIERLSFDKILSQFLSMQQSMPVTEAQKASTGLIFARAIMLGHIEAKAQVSTLPTKLEKVGDTNPQFQAILRALYIEKAAQPISEEEFKRALPPELEAAPWISSLLKSDLISSGALNCCAELPAKVRVDAKKAATIFILAVSLATLLGALGVISLLTFLLIAAFQDLNFRYEPNLKDAQPFLEQFVLYFIALNLVFILVGSVATQENTLQYNLFGILSLFVIALWPTIRGYTIGELASALGIKVRSFWQLIGDIIAGPLTFVSAWAPFIMFSALYSLLLTALGTSPAQGSHPIVPVLLDRNQAEAITLLTLLAVVIVPIQEELMFRGALYSWLRSKNSRMLSIFLCGFIFAVVHPQGPIGVLPLTLIGMLLAFLREWRGTLLPCILLHMCINGGIFLVMWGLRG